MPRAIIGLVEYVRIFSQNSQSKRIAARIDTGATKSSIDAALAAELHLGPIVETKLIKSVHGKTLRPIIRAYVRVDGRKLKATFSIADRAHMKYKVLIGQDVLKSGAFLIDPKKR